MRRHRLQIILVGACHPPAKTATVRQIRKEVRQIVTGPMGQMLRTICVGRAGCRQNCIRTRPRAYQNSCNPPALRVCVAGEAAHIGESGAVAEHMRQKIQSVFRVVRVRPQPQQFARRLRAWLRGRGQMVIQPPVQRVRACAACGQQGNLPSARGFAAIFRQHGRREDGRCVRVRGDQAAKLHPRRGVCGGNHRNFPARRAQRRRVDGDLIRELRHFRITPDNLTHNAGSASRVHINAAYSVAYVPNDKAGTALADSRVVIFAYRAVFAHSPRQLKALGDAGARAPPRHQVQRAVCVAVAKPVNHIALRPRKNFSQIRRGLAAGRAGQIPPYPSGAHFVVFPVGHKRSRPKQIIFAGCAGVQFRAVFRQQPHHAGFVVGRKIRIVGEIKVRILHFRADVIQRGLG